MLVSPFKASSLHVLNTRGRPTVRKIHSTSIKKRSVAQIFGALGIFALAAIAPAAQAQDQLTPGSFRAYAAEGIEPRLSDFSGLPVPRYASLRFDEVNGRSGPSLDYPVKWTYERAGLPVVVIRESNEWRKVRDPMGDEVWVNASQLAEQRTAITTHAGAMVETPAPESVSYTHLRAHET